VRSSATQSINTIYRIDDGTGLIEVKKWIDSDKPETIVDFAPDTYVRVFGRLQSYNGKRSVNAHYIRAITDFNEVNYHLLEATHVHLLMTKGSSAAGGGQGGAGTDADGDSMFVDSGYGASAAGGGGAADARLATCSPGARAVYNFMANSPGDGANVGQVVAGTRMSAADVLTAAEELLGHGVIYTTDNDETWAILDI
jgi:replication factor A2